MKNDKKEISMEKKIKAAALKLMAKKGLKDISMREIAEACGVTKPVLYYYFKNKEDLCITLITEGSAANNKKLEDFIAAGASFEEILVFLFSEYVKEAAAKDNVAFIIHVSSYLLSNKELNKKLCPVGEVSYKLISDILEKEYKKGSLDKKGKELAFHLIFANLAHFILNNYRNENKFWPSYPKDMARAVLTAVNYKEK